MYMLKRDKKDEESGASGNPFHNLDKTTVLQEARVFNQTPINPRKCSHLLTKILYIINQGSHINTTEATEVFFAVTKLFQAKDVILRRLVYLCIKELSNTAEDVIIVTSSLTKDMTGKEDMFRAAAIRTLCRITDHTMLQSIERYMKQAIVDKNHSVASAALASSLFLSRDSPDVVKRWVNEVQEACNNDNIMVQYHALGLLYHIRKSDRLAVKKLVEKFTSRGAILRSPYAYCLLIRIASKLIDEDGSGSESPYFDFIDCCLRHKSEMVVYEAAASIVNMKQSGAKELAPAVSVLQLFCGSPKPSLRFAAVKTLNKVAMTHPAVVTACNLDLENLITDVNRSIATLAITTLLKTGNESSVDRLMKQITTFMSEISDEFKTVVIQAIKQLCMKFPRKHGVMMTFLSSMLRDEGGFEYKKAIVDTVICIIEDNAEAKEAGLSHLCEFIEDCEHTVLATKILHLLGREGPRTISPSKYIRYIYNRVILENAAVRAAAVSALAKFGATSEELLPSILVLLERCLLDTDDEVRDRAIFYLRMLEKQDKAMNNNYLLNTLQVSIVGLERALYNYCQEPSEKPFDMKSVPIETQPINAEKKVNAEMPSTKPQDKVQASRQDIFAEQLSGVPEFAMLGPLFKSSAKPVELTESETEYVVQCVKHTFAHHIVFQFDCSNTLSDQLLECVTVQMEPTEPGFEVVRCIPITSLVYNQPGVTYTCIKLPDDPSLAASCSFTNTLKFIVKDCDPSTMEADDDGYNDEYVLEDVEVGINDHVQPVIRANFMAAWDEMGADNEMADTYALSTMTSIPEAVEKIVHFLGLQACERSDKVGEGKSAHTLYLAGIYRGGADVLVTAKLAMSDMVNLNITVRSTDPGVSEIIASSVG